MNRVLQVSIVTLLLASGAMATLPDDCPPVSELRRSIDQDEDVRSVVDAMFEGLQPMPDGTPNPWQGRSVDELYAFLNEWYRFLPGREDGLDRIIEFSLLYRNNPAGMRFVSEEPGLGWTLSFVEARGAYMDSEASIAGIRTWLDDETLRHEDFVAPVGGFGSFNEFFIRDLRPGARPITGVDDDGIIVSPANRRADRAPRAAAGGTPRGSRSSTSDWRASPRATWQRRRWRPRSA